MGPGFAPRMHVRKGAQWAVLAVLAVLACGVGIAAGLDAAALRGGDELSEEELARWLAKTLSKAEEEGLAGNLTGLCPEAINELQCTPTEPPAWFFISMPFVSAFVGWVTKYVALRMLFYPYKFWGLNLVRFKDQPIGLFGWQGIVPTKAAKMASNSVDLMTTRLFNMQEIFHRIKPAEASEHLKKGFAITLDRMVDDISDRFILDKSTSWKRTESVVKGQITNWALAELPGFTTGFMGELVSNLDDVYDLKHMCVTEMVANPDILVSVFKDVGDSELWFLQKAGAYMGFVIGIFQALIFYFIIPPPYADYMLPVLGFLLGYITDWMCLKYIFWPVNPVNLCGFKIQGLFLKRQQEASAKFASRMVGTTLHSERIWYYMMNGPKSDKFEVLLRHHADAFTERMLGYTKPLVIAYMGNDNFVKMRKLVQDMTVDEIENIIKYMHDYTNKALDLENEITVKMQALPSAEFEQVLHPIFQEDEFKLILVGGCIGALVGLGMMFVGFAMYGPCFSSVGNCIPSQCDVLSQMKFVFDYHGLEHVYEEIERAKGKC
jgi:uncharacterized membrane protein YheB (UPF0754 family)